MVLDQWHICTICHERPRHVTSGGLHLRYCTECNRERQRKYNRDYVGRKREPAPEMCIKCGVNPRYVSSTGRTKDSVCLECRREEHRQWEANRKRTQFALTVIPEQAVAPAPTQMCIDCGIRPRHAWSNGKKITRCKECYTVYHRDAKRNLAISRRQSSQSEPNPPTEQPSQEHSWNLLAQSTLLLDQSRSAVMSGQVETFAIQLTVDGVSLTLAATKKVNDLA